VDDTCIFEVEFLVIGILTPNDWRGWYMHLMKC